MLIRSVLAALLLVPFSARAQFSVIVTQVGLASGRDAPSHAGLCARDACRAVLPVRLPGDICALNVRVGAPTAEGWGSVLFAAGPCRSGHNLTIPTNAAETGYTLNHLFAASETFALPLQAATASDTNPLIDDGVLHEAVMVRLDIVADRRR